MPLEQHNICRDPEWFDQLDHCSDWYLMQKGSCGMIFTGHLRYVL